MCQLTTYPPKPPLAPPTDPGGSDTNPPCDISRSTVWRAFQPDSHCDCSSVDLSSQASHKIRLSLQNSAFQRSSTSWLALGTSLTYLFHRCKTGVSFAQALANSDGCLQNIFEVFPPLSLHFCTSAAILWPWRSSMSWHWSWGNSGIIWKTDVCLLLLWHPRHKRSCCCCCKWSGEQGRWRQSELEKHKLDLIKAGMLSGDASTVESVVSHSWSMNWTSLSQLHHQHLMKDHGLYPWEQTADWSHCCVVLFSLSCSFYFKSVSSVSFGS